MVYRVNVEHISRFLQEVDVFRGLSERHLLRIAALCEEETFAAGERLTTRDERGAKLFVLRTGELKVSTGSRESDVVVRTLYEKETFPLAIFMEPPTLLTTNEAITDIEAYTMSRVRLLELCELETRIGLHIYKACFSLLMSRYRYMLAELADLMEPGTRINPAWKGAEV